MINYIAIIIVLAHMRICVACSIACSPCLCDCPYSLYLHGQPGCVCVFGI